MVETKNIGKRQTLKSIKTNSVCFGLRMSLSKKSKNGDFRDFAFNEINNLKALNLWI
jgi:hypothetical protein